MSSCQNSEDDTIPVDEHDRALRRRRRVVALPLQDVDAQSGDLDEA